MRALYEDQRLALIKALDPLVKIADAYGKSELDEVRPEWREKGIGPTGPLGEVELFSGRGGGQLLTLGNCFQAREVVEYLQ